MRIDSYNLNTFPAKIGGIRPAQQTPAGASKTADETHELSAQEKLRRLLEEKRTLAQISFDSEASGPTLGKNIDLRV